MTPSLDLHSYGKSQIRLSHVTRSDTQHEFIELTVDITLAGDFDAAYTEGSNAAVIPTDTMKNTVYALAKKHGVDSCESFAMKLSKHFFDSFSHVSTAEVSIHEQTWTRLQSDSVAHPHAFIGGGNEQNFGAAVTTESETTLRSGLVGLQVLKTTDSAFRGFLQDGYTTLRETDDRIFATTIEATWPADDLNADWTSHRLSIRAAILDVFANNFSPSVQKTLFEMAAAAFAACSAIDGISLTMPNQHHFLADLQPLGLENNLEVFVPTAEPFGVISATVQRDKSTL